MKKKASSKKVSNKKTPNKKTIKKKTYTDFDSWWNLFGEKMTSKIEKDWIKDNEPNDPDEEEGGDHWHVNEMMHNGDAHEMTSEIAAEFFEKGLKNESCDFGQCDSLYCELDDVTLAAYEAGKKLYKA